MDCMEGYDAEFWNKYADENESRYNPEFAGFVKNLAASLGCASVLEVGCGTGIDLRMFPDSFKVFGVDMNDRALGIARERHAHGTYEKGDIAALPFDDSSVDFVYTHGLLNYLDDATLEKGVAEMYRVASRYIMNCEEFEEDEARIDDRKKLRNMYNRWLCYKVKVISNVDMHKDIEPASPRFTLLRKL